MLKCLQNNIREPIMKLIQLLQITKNRQEQLIPIKDITLHKIIYE